MLARHGHIFYFCRDYCGIKMKFNKHILINKDALEIRYRGRVVYFPIADVYSVSIVKTKSSGFLTMLLRLKLYSYHIRIELTKDQVELFRIRSKDRKQLAKEISKFMDETFEQRVQ
jgi:hypothetical protein